MKEGCIPFSGHAQASVMPYDFRKSLLRKGIILGCLVALAAVTFFIIRRYFYYLDAYLYTYEFYWLFNVNNLRAANTSMFVEYYRPMGISTEALPQIIFSHLVQNYYLPFSKPILVSAAGNAFGVWLGSLFSYVALLMTGLVSFAIGTFFLGDILPYIKGEKFEAYRRNLIPAAGIIILPLLFAIPWIPVSFPAIAGAFFKVPTLKMGQCILLGLSLRIIWFLAAPSLFL